MNSPLLTVLRQDEPVRAGLGIIFIVLVAYVLDAINFTLIRIYEGYWMREQHPFAFFEGKLREHVKWVVGKRQEVQDQITQALNEIKGKKKGDPGYAQLLEKLEELGNLAAFLESELTNKFPEDPEFVTPFSLGNAIAAAEQYPRKVFGMDAIVFWPFLAPILTKRGYAQFVIREKSMLDLLLNLITVLGIFGAIFGFLKWFQEGWTVQLVVALGLILLINFLLYQVSIQAAVNWGATIRTALVLFREDLRQTLRLRQPMGSMDEHTLWEYASEFYKACGTDERQRQCAAAIFTPESYRQPIYLIKEG